MPSYFNACGATVANSNHKNVLNIFGFLFVPPHFEKRSATHGHNTCHHKQISTMNASLLLLNSDYGAMKKTFKLNPGLPVWLF